MHPLLISLYTYIGVLNSHNTLPNQRNGSSSPSWMSHSTKPSLCYRNWFEVSCFPFQLSVSFTLCHFLQNQGFNALISLLICNRAATNRHVSGNPPHVGPFGLCFYTSAHCNYYLDRVFIKKSQVCF